MAFPVHLNDYKTAFQSNLYIYFFDPSEIFFPIAGSKQFRFLLLFGAIRLENRLTNKRDLILEV